MKIKIQQLIKKWWPTVMWALVLISAAISFAFMHSKQNSEVCKKLIIQNVDDKNGFIDNADIIEMLALKSLNPVGKPLNEINTAMLESIINSNPYVANTEVFSTIDGKVHVTIKQRNPVVRIINQTGENYYIDDAGYLMPVSSKFTAEVMVANGNINDVYNHKQINTSNDTATDVLSQIFKVATYLQNDTIRNSMFTQLFVTNNNQIELIPRIGNHIVQIGNASALPEKINKLMVFYVKGLNKTGWDTYSIINVQYHRQVVCTRKQELAKQ